MHSAFLTKEPKDDKNPLLGWKPVPTPESCDDLHSFLTAATSLAESCSQNILEGSLAPDLRRLASLCPCRSFYAQTFGKGGDAWVELEAPWRSQQRHREEMTEFPELEEENRKL